MPTYAGEEIFRITNDFFATHGIHWSNCISVCADGASAIVGADKGFAAWVKCQNPAIQITHCCIHREALMTKLLPHELSEAMSDCIEIVNLIKSRALNSRIFSNVCEEMGSEHQSLLYYTSVTLYNAILYIAILYNFLRTFFLENAWACVLGLEHSCLWPREVLSLVRLSLALTSDFFCVLGLGLEPCVLDSTSGRCIKNHQSARPRSITIHCTIFQ